jgi:pyruvate/2-oxoglutarate dehydrogenase complex dihydrolipoamide acyltransferase (E2) component
MKQGPAIEGCCDGVRRGLAAYACAPLSFLLATPMRTSTLALLSVCLVLSACNKKEPAAEAGAAAPAPATAQAPAPAPAAAAEPTEEERKRAQLQGKLDYATLEQRYLSDSLGQWATSAQASSGFGDKPDVVKADPTKGRAWKAVGAPDDYEWSQQSPDLGMDWLETRYAKPVRATEVRAVLTNSDAVKAITKVELVDEAGALQTVWSGISEAQRDERGPRTWLVHTFPKTDKPIVGVRLTFANAVSTGYKEVDAVQLVGE